MKTPRVHDFDPTAKIPELTSPLDGMPAIQKPKPAGSTPLPERANAPTPVDLNASTNERFVTRRMIKRASYELFADQIEDIRRLAAGETMQGGKGNQSEMVRDAIDAYLRQKRKGK
jgi:hypothetical protein